MSSDQIVISEVSNIKQDNRCIKVFKNNVIIQAGNGIEIKSKLPNIYTISTDASNGVINTTTYSSSNVMIGNGTQKVLQSITLSPKTVVVLDIVIVAAMANGQSSWVTYTVSYNYLSSTVIQSGDYIEKTYGLFPVNIIVQSVSPNLVQVIVIGDSTNTMSVNYSITVSESVM